MINAIQIAKIAVEIVKIVLNALITSNYYRLQIINTFVSVYQVMLSMVKIAVNVITLAIRV